MQKKTIKVVNKSTNPLPKYETPDSAGMDIRAWVNDDNFPGHLADWDEVEKCVRIFSGGRALIHTGLYIELPKGYEAQVRPRSGLALKQGITVLNTPGTIDADYRGEVGVILINMGDDPVEIHTGDRIAQIVISKCEQLDFTEAEDLSETERGEGGFGHTGKA